MNTDIYGAEYKEKFKSINGGWGMLPWCAGNYLKPEEFPLWIKICEFSYKNTKGDGIVHLTQDWLYNFFSEDGGEEYVKKNLDSLSTIGYIDYKFLDEYVDIHINYEIVRMGIRFFGNSRKYAQRLRKAKQGRCYDGTYCDESLMYTDPEDLVKISKELEEEKG